MWRIAQIVLFCLLYSNWIVAQLLIPQAEEKQFAHFLLGLEHQTPTQQAEQIGALLAKAEQDNATARFLILAEKYLYEPNSPYRNDERYLLFLQYVATHQLADYTTNPRYQKHYTMVQKNRVGHKATDFPYTTQAGEKGQLYDLQSPYILLFFHDPNCEECQLVKQQLESQHAHFLQKGVQVVAVYIDDEVEAWLKAQYPSAWLSVYAPEIEQQDLYDIKALPTLYLLDTNKYVLQKDARLDKILKYKF